MRSRLYFKPHAGCQARIPRPETEYASRSDRRTNLPAVTLSPAAAPST
ncbi:hypothetical protein GLE_3963 [Lysobacter enzymogenes]|uniref:Uncharacterized protein n=1 Tax=Lysobacter enzymogenes TaxID=69 RepID=A0A0S2DLJ2_LYSEN|nr:hypothetical protein GLE_3963 [Lysobacter enzymogenes]